MKKFIYILLFFFPLFLHAQDPGTVVGIYIKEDGKIITGTKMDEYDVSVERMHKVTIDHGTGLFHGFCWDPYNDQHYMITIKHRNEKMKIEFYIGNMVDFENEPNQFFWNASFRLDVEFIPGKYYKIDKFKKTTGENEFKLEPESHEWNFWICSVCFD